MAFRDLKDFQRRLAHSAMSRYAEAILAISAVAQSIVSSVGRVVQQYASIRNSIQLVTTNQDDEFVDETTSDREVIADSVFVQAWQNIATAVERLISLRRDLSSEGVVSQVDNYPSQVDTLKVITTLPTITPRVGSESLQNGGYIYIPTNHLLNTDSSDRRVRLSPMPFSGRFDGVSYELLNDQLEFTKGEQFSINSANSWSSDRYPIMGTNKIVLSAVLLVSPGSTEDQPQVGGVSLVLYDAYSGVFECGIMFLSGVSYGSTIDGMTQITFSSAGFQLKDSSGAMTEALTVMPTPSDTQTVTQRLVVVTNTPSTEEITVDPLDPYSVFSQAYDAASLLVEFLDDIGYPTALSDEDKRMLRETISI